MPPALFDLCFSDKVSHNLSVAGLTSLSSYLCLPHNWDYRYVTPCLACLLTWSLANFLLWLASNYYLPSLHLLSSWDSRHVPLWLALGYNFSFSLYGHWRRDVLFFFLAAVGITIWPSVKKTSLLLTVSFCGLEH
jgi:hypothetical protein